VERAFQSERIHNVVLSENNNSTSTFFLALDLKGAASKAVGLVFVATE
jgi:hypothetical protein